MHIIKQKHNRYPDCMSAPKTIIKTKSFHIDIQEFYDPHWLEINLWVRNKREDPVGFFVLRKWKKIGLNKYARQIIKSSKAPGNIEIIHRKLKEKLKEEN